MGSGAGMQTEMTTRNRKGGGRGSGRRGAREGSPSNSEMVPPSPHLCAEMGHVSL